MSSAAPTSSSGDVPARRKSRVGRRVLWLVLALFGVWVAVAGLTVARAADQLRTGQRDVESVRGHLTASELEGPGPTNSLRSANRHFSKGASLLSSHVVAPAWVIPVAGRQLRALRDLSRSAAQVAGVGSKATADARSALTASKAAGGDRVALLRSVASIAATAQRQLVAVHVPTARALVGPIASRRDKFRKDLTDLMDTLSRGGAATAAMADLMQGPHRYLLLGANNAEMRSGSGMFLTAGVIETDNGHVSIRDIQHTADMHLDGDGVPYEGQLKDHWDFAHPNREWRNLGLAPDFDQNAALAVRMWEARSGEHLEGAIAADSVAFAGLLKFSGPVQGLGQTINADNGLAFLLHDQYTIGDPRSVERHEALGDIAGQVFSVLEHGDADVALGQQLSGDVEGRHIMVWSSDPAQEARWQQAGVSGVLGVRDVLVSVQNRGANKLDQFLKVAVRAEMQPKGDQTEVELHVTTRNDVPTGEPTYIAGPNEGAVGPEGTYTGLVSVNVPEFASSASVDGAPSYAAVGPEGNTSVLAVPVVLDRGVERETVVRFAVPTRVGWFRVVPSARAAPISWSIGGTQFSDVHPKVVSLGA